MVHFYVRETTDPLAGRLPVPSSKYHAHRALILASLAEGETRIVGSSAARHVQWTIDVLRRLGTEIEETADGFRVQGGRYRPISDEVSVGSSGTTLYFMLGLASLADAPVTIKGQKYFQRRPVAPLLEALGELGLEISSSGATPPFQVAPRPPRGGRVRIDGTLSQWISAILLLAPFASRPTVLDVEGEPNELPYVELTVRMMRQFGLEVEVSDDWRHYEIAPEQEARPTSIELPPDLGSAAFGLAACALHPSDVRFPGLRETRGEDIDHPEAEFMDIVAEMGLPLERDESGQVRVRHDGAPLRGVDIDCRPMPDMLPALTVIAQFAEGETRFHNIEHVRLKESDRVVSMLQLNSMGGTVEVRDDKLVVTGAAERLRGAPLSSFNDHRVQMALAVAATRAEGASSLTYPRAFRISYPEFLEDMRGIGLRMAIGPDAEVLAERPEQPSRSPAAGPEAVESVAIDQAAEVPLTEWVARWAHERPGPPRRGRGQGGGDAPLDLARARGRVRRAGDEAARARRRAGRDRRLPAAQLGRLHDPHPGGGEGRGGRLRADADLPRARDRARPAPLAARGSSRWPTASAAATTWRRPKSCSPGPSRTSRSSTSSSPLPTRPRRCPRGAPSAGTGCRAPRARSTARRSPRAAPPPTPPPTSSSPPAPRASRKGSSTASTP